MVCNIISFNIIYVNHADNVIKMFFVICSEILSTCFIQYYFNINWKHNKFDKLILLRIINHINTDNKACLQKGK